MDTRAARPFSFSFNTSDYRILLMDQDQGRLYLGSREYLVALDMHNVNKEPLIVRTTSTSLNPVFCWVPSLCIFNNQVFFFLPFSKIQIHWPASAKRKGECQMTGKGRQVGTCVYILLFQKRSEPSPFFFQDGTMTTMLFKIPFVLLLLSRRASVPTLCAS